VVAVAAGAVVLIPALVLLFGLYLRGRLGPADEAERLQPLDQSQKRRRRGR